MASLDGTRIPRGRRTRRGDRGNEGSEPLGHGMVPEPAESSGWPQPEAVSPTVKSWARASMLHAVALAVSCKREVQA